ncbi:MAG: hypothetical protein JWQ90_3570 [Hydrocarboniphaga sp.]|nr:hypothetical protein [Hydrocarboniphaga sp.]
MTSACRTDGLIGMVLTQTRPAPADSLEGARLLRGLDRRCVEDARHDNGSVGELPLVPGDPAVSVGDGNTSDNPARRVPAQFGAPPDGGARFLVVSDPAAMHEASPPAFLAYDRNIAGNQPVPAASRSAAATSSGFLLKPSART